MPAQGQEGVSADFQDTSRKLLCEEIARIVSDAALAGETLSTGGHAARLFAAYPGANWSVGHIVDELVLEATRRGVPMEIARPGDGSHFG